MSAEPRRLSQALADLRDIQAEIHGRSDPRFHERLAGLRRWQSQKVARLHAERAAAHNGQALLSFLTERFYVEADWSELTGRPEKMAATVEHIVDRDRPLVIAIELQAAAERLDMEMTDALLAEDRPLNAYSYVRTLRRLERGAARLQQMAWLEELIDLVADYADNRPAYWAFKLARAPAHTFGIGRTYELLAEGYAALRATRDLKPGVHAVIADQRARLERLMGQPLDT